MLIEGNGSLSNRFYNLQKILNPDLTIEIGAHAAEFSIAMSLTSKDIKSIAFEANPMVFNINKKELAATKVDYINQAISNFNGELTINIHEDDFAGNNSIKVRKNAEIINTQTIACSTLDKFLMQYKFHNLCLWIDVEGANREVLEGARSSLKHVSSIFIETEDFDFWEDQWLTEDVEKFLMENGFLKFDSENVYEAQQNIIFVKSSKKYHLKIFKILEKLSFFKLFNP